MRTPSAARRILMGVVFTAVVACVVLIASVALAAPESLSFQSVDATGFPKVVLRVVLPPEMLAGGKLGARNFSLSENGVGVKDLKVRAIENRAEPMYVVLAMDTSGSMAGDALSNAQNAAKGFVDAMGPDSKVALVAFSDTARVVVPFSQDKPALGAAIDELTAAHETALYDALSVAADQFAGLGKGDKAIVLLSDGGDTTSASTLEAVAGSIAAAKVPIYAVALQTSEYNVGALESLTRASGGRLVSAADSAQLGEVFSAIARQIQSPYELTYTSFEPPTKDIEIDLMVDSRDVRATASAAIPNPRYSTAPAKSAPAPSTPGIGWPLAIAALAFFTVGLLAAGVLLLVQREPHTLRQLSYYDQLQRSAADTGSEGAVDPTSPRGRLLAVAGSVAARGGFEAAIRTELERAGLPLRPVEYMTLHVTLVLGVGLLVQVVFRNVLLTMLAIILLALGPVVLLEMLARRRLAAFEAQLPDVLNLLASSLRAGWGLLQAIGIVVSEIGPPAGPEFGRVMTEARLGLALEEALDKMSARLGSEDFSWAVVAIAIQREVGGNLAEVLDTVANTVRERGSLRRQVSALTAEGRLSAIILIALPIVEAFVIYTLNPGYIAVLLSSTIGVMSAIGAIVLLIVGALWLRAIVKIEV